MRGKKAKKIRRMYAQWLKTITPAIPEGMRAISERVFRKRVVLVPR